MDGSKIAVPDDIARLKIASPRAALDEIGVPYPSNSLKADLQRLLAASRAATARDASSFGFQAPPVAPAALSPRRAARTVRQASRRDADPSPIRAAPTAEGAARPNLFSSLFLAARSIRGPLSRSGPDADATFAAAERAIGYSSADREAQAAASHGPTDYTGGRTVRPVALAAPPPLEPYAPPSEARRRVWPASRPADNPRGSSGAPRNDTRSPFVERAAVAGLGGAQARVGFDLLGLGRSPGVPASSSAPPTGAARAAQRPAGVDGAAPAEHAAAAPAVTSTAAATAAPAAAAPSWLRDLHPLASAAMVGGATAALMEFGPAQVALAADRMAAAFELPLVNAYALLAYASGIPPPATARLAAPLPECGDMHAPTVARAPGDDPVLQPGEAPPLRSPVEELVRLGQDNSRVLSALTASIIEQTDRSEGRQDNHGMSDGQSTLRWAFAQGLSEADPTSGIAAGKGAVQALTLRLSESDRNVSEFGLRFPVTHSLVGAFTRVQLGGVPLSMFASRPTDELLLAASPLASPAPKGGGVLPAERPLSDESAFRDCVANLAQFVSFVYCTAAGDSFAALGAMALETMRLHEWFSLEHAVMTISSALANFSSVAAMGVNIVTSIAASIPGGTPVSGSSNGILVFMEIAGARRSSGLTDVNDPWHYIRPGLHDGVYERSVRKVEDLMHIAAQRHASALMRKVPTARARGEPYPDAAESAAAAPFAAPPASPDVADRPPPLAGGGGLPELLPGELVAAIREAASALPSGDARPACVKFMSNDGCAGGCKRVHVPPPSPTPQVLELVLARMGGPSTGTAIPPASRAGVMRRLRSKFSPASRAAVATAAGNSTRGRGGYAARTVPERPAAQPKPPGHAVHYASAPPVDLHGAAGSTHVMEQPLAATFEPPPSRQQPPPRFVAVTDVPDTPRKAAMRKVQARLHAIVAGFSGLSPDLQAYGTHYVATWLAGAEPTNANVSALLGRTAAQFRRSHLPGVEEAARLLLPPPPTSAAGRGALLVSRFAKVFPRPPAPKEGERPTTGNVELLSETFQSIDFGDTIGLGDDGRPAGNQCVLVAYSAMLELDKTAYATRVRAEARRLLTAGGGLAVPPVLSMEELQRLQHAHDLTRPVGYPPGIDALFILHFGCELFENRRVYILTLQGSGSPIDAYCVEPRGFCEARNQGSSLLLLIGGHAFLGAFPARFGPRRFTPNGAPAPISHEAAAAFERTLLAAGVVLRRFSPLSAGELAQLPKVVDSGTLDHCPCCDTPLRLWGTRAGRALLPTIPPRLGDFGRMWDVYGGLSSRALQLCAKDLGAARRQVAGLTDDDIAVYPFSPEVAELARSIQANATTALSSISKADVKANEKAALVSLSSGLCAAMDGCDELVARTSSVPLAIAALRQARFSRGERTLDPQRLMANSHMLPQSTSRLLMDLSMFGAPLFQVSRLPPGSRRPAPSAEAVAGQIARDALSEVGSGFSILVSAGRSDRYLAEADAVFNQVAAVPKKPDGVGGPPAYRTITNARPFNTLNAADNYARLARGIRLAQPPSACPSLVDVARTVVYLARRFPGLAVMVSIQDGSAAYKCFNLPVGDACSQAMQLPTRGLALRGAVPVLVCASGIFGAQYAGGWYGIPAHTVADMVSNASPQEPTLDGTGNAVGQVHVDDHVHIAVDLGDNLLHAQEAYKRCHAVVFGEGKLNADKGDGTFSPKAKFWGRVVDLSGLVGASSIEAGLAACTFGTDEAKYAALAEALESTAFAQLERRRVPLQEHERLKGLVQWLSGTSMVIRTTLGPMHEMSASSDALHVAPYGSEASVSLKWERYAHALAVLGGVASSCERRSVGLLSPLLGCLTVSEQVALGRELTWLASDGCLVREPAPRPADAARPAEAGAPHPEPATAADAGVSTCLSAGFSFADHGLRVWSAHDALPFADAIRTRVGDDLPMIIYIVELLGLTCAARVHAEAWRGKLKAYAIDNSPAYFGLKKLYSRHPFAGYCYRIIAVNLARVNCDLYPLWVATDNNPFADMGSRDVLTLAPAELGERVAEFYPGYSRVDLGPVISEILYEGFGAVPSVIIDRQRSPHAVRLTAAGLTFFEAFPGPLAAGSVAAVAAGFKCVGIYEPCPTSRASALARLGAAAPCKFAAIASAQAAQLARLPTSVDCLLAAGVPRAGSGGDGFFQGDMLRLADQLRPRLVIIELRPGQLWAGGPEVVRLDNELGRRGLYRLSPPGGPPVADEAGFELVHFASDLEGAHAGIRHLLQYERREASDDLVGLLPPRDRRTPLVLRDILDPVHLLPSDIQLPWERFHPSPRRPRLGVPILAGMYLLPGGPVEGVERGDRVKLRGKEGFWIVQRILPGGGVDAQAEEDIDGPGRRGRGIVSERLSRKVAVLDLSGPGQAPRTYGHYPEGPSRTLILDTRGPSHVVRPLSAREVFRLHGHADSAYESTSAFVGGERRQAAIASASLSALTAEAVLARAVDRLSTPARREQSPAEGERPEHSVHDVSYATTRARGGERHAGRPRGALSRDGIRSGVAALVAGSISTGTSSTYASQVHHWWRWRAGGSLPPYLDGVDPVADQESLVEFVAFVGIKMRYRHATVHVMLYAVRYHHIVGRRPDPLANAPLLTNVMVGLKRLQGGRRQKVPVTVSIMRCSAKELNLDDWDDLVLQLGISLMFVFLLRSREALRKGAQPDAEQCMRVRSLMLARDGVPVPGAPADADELILHIPRSKADQEGLGFIANAFETPGDPLCPVALLKRARLMKPQHFARPDNFLLVMSDGRVLSRDRVVEALRPAAAACGVPPESLSVISLRAGGASAMWDAGFGVDEIKRRGRWASECWRIYTWEGRERARSVAARMLGSSVSVLGAVARFARE